NRRRGYFFSERERETCCDRRPPQGTGDFSRPRGCGGGRSCEVRRQGRLIVPSRRRLYRPNSAWREGGRPAGAAVVQTRNLYQHEDRQVTRYRYPARPRDHGGGGVRVNAAAYGQTPTSGLLSQPLSERRRELLVFRRRPTAR